MLKNFVEFFAYAFYYFYFYAFSKKVRAICAA